MNLKVVAVTIVSGVFATSCAQKAGEGAAGASKNTPQACVSQMALESRNRVTSDALDIGHTSQTWALVAGELIINIKSKKDGVQKAAYARVDVKQTGSNQWSAGLGCAFLNDSEGDIEIPFGLAEIDDRSRTVSRSASVILNPKNKSASLKTDTALAKTSLKTFIALEQLPSDGFKVSSYEVYQNSKEEIVFKSTLKKEGATEIEYISIQKLRLQ